MKQNCQPPPKTATQKLQIVKNAGETAAFTCKTKIETKCQINCVQGNTDLRSAISSTFQGHSQGQMSPTFHHF